MSKTYNNWVRERFRKLFGLSVEYGTNSQFCFIVPANKFSHSDLLHLLKSAEKIGLNLKSNSISRFNFSKNYHDSKRFDYAAINAALIADYDAIVFSSDTFSIRIEPLGKYFAIMITGDYDQFYRFDQWVALSKLFADELQFIIGFWWHNFSPVKELGNNFVDKLIIFFNNASENFDSGSSPNYLLFDGMAWGAHTASKKFELIVKKSPAYRIIESKNGLVALFVEYGKSDLHKTAELHSYFQLHNI